MKDFKKLELWQQILAITLGVVAIYLLLKFVFNWIKKINNQNLINNSIGTGQSGSGTVYQVDLGTKAVSIYNAFHDNDWFGFSEDEEKAIQELISVPKQLIPDLSSVYFKLYGKNLKEDFIKYCSNEQFNKIADKFQ